MSSAFVCMLEALLWLIGVLASIALAIPISLQCKFGWPRAPTLVASLLDG